MRSTSKIAPLIAIALACARAPAPVAPAPTGACFAIPQSLGDYRLRESESFDDPDEGTSYRFSDGSADRVTVFVYPAPSPPQSERERRELVNVEGGRFEQTLPVGVDRGWYDSYRVAFSHADSVSAGGVVVPAYLVGVATRRGPGIAVEAQFLYLICNHFLKIRATLPGDSWTDSTVPIFAKDLARHLAEHRP